MNQSSQSRQRSHPHDEPCAEQVRLIDDEKRTHNWKRWGPYLSERQWGTVREDYSPDGACWTYLPHDHARSRAYRWGEDGLLGICDRQGRLCFALALWNGKDPILKERLFGLTGPEGNHGEDVKELYFYLDSTPTHSYMKALYKYPQAEYPYDDLIRTNARRTRGEREYELLDTGVFDKDRYFDVMAEYAKAAPNDILIRIKVTNRGPEAAPLHLLPTLWFRNTWSWGPIIEGLSRPPKMALRPHASRAGPIEVDIQHDSLGEFFWAIDTADMADTPQMLFTENETNGERLFGEAIPVNSARAYYKDAFNNYVVRGDTRCVNPESRGTKSAACFRMNLSPGQSQYFRMRLCKRAGRGKNSGGEHIDLFGEGFEQVLSERLGEADEFFDFHFADRLDVSQQQVARQAYAGLMWCKQFYYYNINEWLDGDPSQPPPPRARREGRNHDWRHLYNRDVISMPDSWEYPWYAAWDLAFHMVAFARIDPEFAKKQLILFMREWYMHPNGQLPAYEFALGDTNPPVHAWACWRVYKMSAARDRRDRAFLVRAFHKLIINFTWWINRKDVNGRYIFSGGFLGLDNIGVFDRNQPLPTGGILEQADGTAWMAFYCATMLSMALELAAHDPAYEDVASKFFEHFVAIADAMNTLGGSGLWNEEDGFYYDQIYLNRAATPLRIRSLVGLIPLIAVQVLESSVINRLPGFKKRMNWFLEHRKDLSGSCAWCDTEEEGDDASAASASAARSPREYLLLAIPSKKRLRRVLRYMLDENEFLSPFGIRSLSRFHLDHPFNLKVDGSTYTVPYTAGEATSSIFGGNSNWRGPVWFPVNYLLIEALERYHRVYGDNFTVEYPTGSGQYLHLRDIADDLSRRLTLLMLPDGNGRRPCFGTSENESRFATDPHWRDLVLFHEYFDGDTGRGLGACHQTGWTALVATCLERIAGHRLGR